MSRSLTSLLTLIVLAGVLASTLFGWLRPIDDALRGWRFSLQNQELTGDIVFVEIDPSSLRDIGVWPWPRSVHAAIVDNLMAAGANEIAFDVDFSSDSVPEADERFAEALEAAGGYVMLAAFLQPDGQSGELSVNLPAPAFLAQAMPVTVNVRVDADGLTRRYPLGFSVEGEWHPSLAAALAGLYSPIEGQFTIDYGFDVSGIVRLSAADVAAGTFDPSLVAGRQVLVGASALELRDNFAVPRYGVLPGAMLQIIAAETLKQGRLIREAGLALSILAALALSALVGLVLRRSVPVALLIGLTASIGTELGALLLLSEFAIAADTGVIHGAQLGFAVVALGRELFTRGLMLDRASRAHATTRGVLDRVISDNFDGVVVINDQGEIIASSLLADHVLGSEAGTSIVGHNMEEVLPAVMAARVAAALTEEPGTERTEVTPDELILVYSDGTEINIDYVITVSYPIHADGSRSSGSGAVACLTFRDVTERKAAEARLTFLASHDPLTGALTRARLVELLSDALSDPARRQLGYTIFLLDLSRFKAINDTLGHSAGDGVLKQVVTRLKSCDVSAVARLGGDSFAVARQGVFSQSAVDTFCRTIIEKVSDVYYLDEHRAIIGAKLGVTDTAISGFDPEVLLSQADMALSAAKSAPSNAFVYYAPEMDEQLKEKQRLEVALRQALVQNQLSVCYQPQFLLATGELVGAEALVRWTHPEMGAISPARFIPVAEETGMILELGAWIMETACREALRWPEHIKIAVNVSPMQFEYRDVVNDVKRALDVTGLHPERLEVEITEGLLISNPRLITSSLQRLRDMGIGIALDDFGTGYSSLSYLGKLPVDKIKIDQSFVKGLPRNQQSAAIIRAVMTLSESLGKTVVAEGIETADQAWMLRLAGCHIGQGYHFGRPLVANELEALIAETARKTKAPLAG